MTNRRSEHELKRLVEQAISDVCGLPRPGLWLCIEHVEAIGRPPERLRVRAALHFLPAGSPFCCGQPGCHLGLFGKRLNDVGDHVRRTMGLRHPIAVEIENGVRVRYHSEVEFGTM